MRIWRGLLLLALGAFGVLGVTGVLGAWNDTLGQWWPVAIIAVGLAEMAAERRVSLGRAIGTAVVLALLAHRRTGHPAPHSVRW
ncbi:MAG TPA: hypothetical protein VFA45_15065 [Actinomycetes bacterium]|nr:hypothetical protein [Actinomycetes bacterium]